MSLDFYNERKQHQAIPASTVVVLRDTASGIEVLLLRRNRRSSFGPNAWVFPGGVVEADDAGSDELDCARYAATRETQEEAGIAISIENLVFFSHWTPPPEMTKRFSTYFFITSETIAKAIEVDGQEITSHDWISPQQAIAHFDSGEKSLLPPTYVTLNQLCAFASSAEAIEYYANKPAKYYAPKLSADGDDMVFLYGEDAGYEAADIAIEGKKDRLYLRGGKYDYQYDERS